MTRALRIDPSAVTIQRRGFRCHKTDTKTRLELIGQIFLSGYHAAIRGQSISNLTAHLESCQAELRGFAYEGAGMGIAITDAIRPWRRGQLEAFLLASRHQIYTAHVGAGWAIARLPFGHKRIIQQLDPVLRYLAFDGYGFHQGYFGGPRALSNLSGQHKFSDYRARAFDQGLGRAFWFVEGADAAGIATRISSFPLNRRADLWSGIGLAAAYAGGMSECELNSLKRLADGYAAHLAQGVAFAAKARQRARNETRYTNDACVTLAGCTASVAAAITDVALEGLPQRDDTYECWRARVRDALLMMGGKCLEKMGDQGEAIRR